MPGQTVQSEMFRKYGAKLDTAVKKHASDATNYGIIRLPAGITNGIAKLVECKFDKYKSGDNTGEYYFRAAGVVISPESVMTGEGEMKVAGLQTSIMEAVCDTKKSDQSIVSVEEHVENILNEMRKLGGEQFTEGASAADLEGLAASLKEAGPYFRFSTSASAARKDPQTGKTLEGRVWENWHGSKGLEDYTPPDAEGGGVDDGTGGEAAPEAPPARAAAATRTAAPARTAASANGNGARTANAPAKVPPARTPAIPARKTPTPPPPPVEEPAEEPFTEDGIGEAGEGELDLNALAENAENGDTNAISQLTDAALAAGISEKDVRSALRWSDVVEMIQQTNADGEANADGTSGGDEPAGLTVGEVYFYKPKDKSGKVAKNAVDVELVSINERTGAVTLKNLTNPKIIYKDVPADEVITG